MTSDRPCDPHETEALVLHLLGDPNARAYGLALEAGQLQGRCAVVGDPDELGGLSTLFGVLGRDSGAREARLLTGFPRFRVRDALRYWRESAGDEAALLKLEQCVVDAAAGRIAVKTVTVTRLDELVIVDGNKRAIALYTARREADFPLTVFVLRGPDQPSVDL
jgi:hypothetical protein